MKTAEATRLYNKAESIVKESNPFIRAAKITALLESTHGETMADEILELVFDNEISEPIDPETGEYLRLKSSGQLKSFDIK